MPVKQIKLSPDSVRADLCLGLAVTGLYTLITMGLIIFVYVEVVTPSIPARAGLPMRLRKGTFPQRAR